MATPIPNWQSLWANYPRGSAAEVKKLIGGNVNVDWIQNTCTIRMSRAFNYASDPIPAKYPGLNVVSGADKKWYAYRVAEFRKYLEAKYGMASIDVKKSGVMGVPKDSFKGNSGIICFRVSIWSDATGHFDVWNGVNCRYEEYFAQSDEAWLWI